MTTMTNTAAHNWRDNLDDVLLDIAVIEGEGWLDRELRGIAGESNENGVAAALRCLDRFDPEDDEDSGWFGKSVYGHGGGNRWCFRYNGLVEFSSYHGKYGDEEKARKLGFFIR